MKTSIPVFSWPSIALHGSLDALLMFPWCSQHVPLVFIPSSTPWVTAQLCLTWTPKTPTLFFCLQRFSNQMHTVQWIEVSFLKQSSITSLTDHKRQRVLRDDRTMWTTGEQSGKILCHPSQTQVALFNFGSILKANWTFSKYTSYFLFSFSDTSWFYCLNFPHIISEHQNSTCPSTAP